MLEWMARTQRYLRSLQVAPSLDQGLDTTRTAWAWPLICSKASVVEAQGPVQGLFLVGSLHRMLLQMLQCLQDYRVQGICSRIATNHRVCKVCRRCHRRVTCPTCECCRTRGTQGPYLRHHQVFILFRSEFRATCLPHGPQ